jgi:hypothetical protein
MPSQGSRPRCGFLADCAKGRDRRQIPSQRVVLRNLSELRSTRTRENRLAGYAPGTPPAPRLFIGKMDRRAGFKNGHTATLVKPHRPPTTPTVVLPVDAARRWERLVVET